MQKAFDQINIYIQQSLANDNTLLKHLADAVLQERGKFIRPTMTVLVSAILNGNIPEKALRGAAVVALLHQASLIHDDVIDEASIRRFARTVHAQFGNKAAVLWGDYVLVSILKFIGEHQDYDYLDLFAKTVQEMIEGEFMQLEQVGRKPCSEELYMQIIEKKTGSLMAMACLLGAIAVNASQKQKERMYHMGKLLGTAFQLLDDLVDYDRDIETGKIPFMDLKAGRFTLPLIYSLEQAPEEVRKNIQDLIIRGAQNNDTVETVCNFINQFGGKAYTNAKIASYHQEILFIIQDTCIISDAQLALIQFVNQLFPADIVGAVANYSNELSSCCVMSS